MKFQTETHIVIDARKLEMLLRLGCKKDVIFDVICGQKHKSTGDKLLDDLLECFATTKTYNNWGGRRRNSGKKHNQLEKQLENQDENQVNGQLGTITLTTTSSISRNNVNSLSTTRANKFTPPTLQDVLDYAKQQSAMTGVGGFSCPQKIAEEFWTHYDSQGWVKSNDAKTPITNWKSLLRSWTLNPNKFSHVGKAAPADYDLPL